MSQITSISNTINSIAPEPMTPETKVLYVSLFKGKQVSQLKTLEQMQAEDDNALKKAKAEGKPLPRLNLTPQLNGTYEAPFTAIVENLSEQNIATKIDGIIQELLKRKQAQPGFNKEYMGGEFGDLLQLTITPVLSLNGRTIGVIQGEIFEKGYTLPANATDIVPFIEADDGKIYMSLGIRKFDPGIGKPATYGGFNNVESDGRYVSPTGTALLEAREEAGLKMKPINAARFEDLMRDHNLFGKDIAVKATLGLKNISNKAEMKANVCHVATIETSNDIMPKGGEVRVGTDIQKRVHTTSVVTMIAKKTDLLVNSSGFFTITIPRPAISASSLKSLYKGGDDISQALVYDATDLIKQAPTFEDALLVATQFHKDQKMGIQHHAEVLAHALHKAHKEFFPATYKEYDAAEKYNP